MQNISFYIDTELFILKQYEEELDYKLLEPSDRRQGKYYKFNENVIFAYRCKEPSNNFNRVCAERHIYTKRGKIIYE